MDSYAVAHDESIFPSSHTFNPSRWLNNPVAPDGKQLSRYMVTFGKGARNCVGMHLAYAEIYIGLASLFRRFDFELYETDRSAGTYASRLSLPNRSLWRESREMREEQTTFYH